VHPNHQIPTTLVLGIGNEFRRDDGVGVAAARMLTTCEIRNVRIESASGEGADLLERWSGFRRLIVIDAVRSTNTSGTVHALDAHTDDIPSDFFHYSSHAFGLAECVQLGRVLGRLPHTLKIFGVEGEDFSVGRGLTPGVARAVKHVVTEVRTMLLDFGQMDAGNEFLTKRK
jgi:hydrogenase maturation protease